MDLNEVERVREAEVYPALFGPPARGPLMLDEALFRTRFRQPSVDARWLAHGVFEFAPTDARASWLYVTSGLSTPWDAETCDPAGPSGAGVEFVLATPRPGDWAVRTLQNMLAFELLLRAGRYAKAKPLAAGDRIPLRETIDGRPECLIRNLVVAEPEGIAPGFELPSGRVRLLGFTGVTEDELAYAQAYGSEAILDKLRKVGFHPLTDPTRPTLLRRAEARDR